MDHNGSFSSNDGSLSGNDGLFDAKASNRNFISVANEKFSDFEIQWNSVIWWTVNILIILFWIAISLIDWGIINKKLRQIAQIIGTVIFGITTLMYFIIFISIQDIFYLFLTGFAIVTVILIIVDNSIQKWVDLSLGTLWGVFVTILIYNRVRTIGEKLVYSNLNGRTAPASR